MSSRRSFVGFVLLCAALTVLCLAPPALGDVFSPNLKADGPPGRCEADCTFREAVLTANFRPGADVVMLEAGSYSLRRGGRGEEVASTGDLDVTDDLTVIGAGADRTFLDARGLDRLFDVKGNVRLELVGVTLRNGDAGGGHGGAVRAIHPGSVVLLKGVMIEDSRAPSGGMGGALFSGGVAEVVESALIGNAAEISGGAIASEGILRVVASTFTGNDAEFEYGGGIYLGSGALLDLDQSTLVANRAMKVGGALYVRAGGEARVAGSILAANQTWSGGADCSGAVTSEGHNLLSTGNGCAGLREDDMYGGAEQLDPMLGALGQHGGPTPTFAPLAGSPVLDRVPPEQCVARDQRGERRLRDGAMCDVGAFEKSDACIAGAETLCLANGRFKISVEHSDVRAENGGEPVPARAASWTDDTGYFWFFDPANVEVIVKVLDGCSAGIDGAWVFASGLTNLGLDLRVEDLATGRSHIYSQDAGKPFEPIQDTGTFSSCG
ncbi:MAG: choice-of-anchor Q domain-containing protein [Acidobacteriota bacterium]